ncbi:envelope glycoprotein M [pteropodid alphaherpesvirus 2]|uniref:Envelope glycoprotein M n=1 Tax=pteropodid alphaherpesvirus 2 TaxID=3118716 RepID=A0A510J707_9ALPH|nr:envelope glycoprotein M [pteropodid alphaherpesvirus 2]BBM13182.1 envelope glycoprotein M [pteropodid alphaherpesvirus 2]
MGRSSTKKLGASEPILSPSSAALTSWRVWCVQAGAFVVSVLCLVGLLILAYFFEAGFPCFYATPITYAKVNETAEVRGGVAAALRLNAPSVVGTYAFTAFLLVIAAAYVITGAATSAYHKPLDVDKRVAAASLVMPQATLILGNVCPWLLQITVLLLSHRVSMLAHLVYIFHFACLAYFTSHFCTRGVFSGTYLRQTHSMMDVAPTHYRVIGPARAVMTNVLLLGTLLATATTAVSMHAIAVANFNLTAPGVLICVTTLFTILVVLLLLVVEGVLSHYVRVLLGPHLGAIAATGILGVATEHYYNHAYYVTESQQPGVQTGVRVTLALVAVFALVMALVRCVRAYLYHRRHHTKFFKHMRATKQRARSAIRRAQASLRDSRHKHAAPRQDSLDPIYSEIQYAGESDAEFDEEYNDGEPIYDEVPSEPDSVVYAQIKHPSRQEPIYDSVPDW